jgi:hypothetical protein
MDFLSVFENLSPDAALLEAASMAIAISRCRSKQQISFLSGILVVISDGLSLLASTMDLQAARKGEGREK